MIKCRRAALLGLVWLTGFHSVSYAQLIEGKDGTLPILNLPMLWVGAGGYDTAQLSLNEFVPDMGADPFNGTSTKPDVFKAIASSPKFSRGFWISRQPVSFEDYFRFLNALAASGRMPQRAFPTSRALPSIGYDTIFYNRDMQVVAKDAAKAQFVLTDAYRSLPATGINFEDTQLFVQWLRLVFSSSDSMSASLQVEIPSLYEIGYALLQRPELTENQGDRLVEWCGLGNYPAMSGVADFDGQFQRMLKEGSTEQLIFKKAKDGTWQATINPGASADAGASTHFHLIVFLGNDKS